MKNKLRILLLVLILIFVGIFVISAAGVRIPYLENYGANFRKNVKNIAESFNWDLPESVDNFLNQTPKPLTTEEKLAIIEEMEKEQKQQEEAATTPTPQIPIKTDKPLSAASKIVAVKNAYAGAYAEYKSMLLCISDTNLVCYSNAGKEEWSAQLQISEPILKTAGNYILVAEKNATKVYLFNGKKLLWENSVENPIVAADVSETGDVVIISDKPHYKGVVSVINHNGDVVFQWNSGKYEVIDADISSSSRHLAVSMLNTDSGADSKISFFKLDEKEAFSSSDFADCIVYDLEFSADMLNVFADNKIIGMNSSGKQAWTKEFENSTLYRYKVEDSGYKLCVFDNSNVAQMNVLTNRGGVKSDFMSQAFPDHVDISDGNLLYNDERTLVLSPLSGKNPKKYKCTRDIYNLLILDSEHLAAVYNSSVEFITVK